MIGALIARALPWALKLGYRVISSGPAMAATTGYSLYEIGKAKGWWGSPEEMAAVQAVAPPAPLAPAAVEPSPLQLGLVPRVARARRLPVAFASGYQAGGLVVGDAVYLPVRGIIRNPCFRFERI